MVNARINAPIMTSPNPTEKANLITRSEYGSLCPATKNPTIRNCTPTTTNTVMIAATKSVNVLTRMGMGSRDLRRWVTIEFSAISIDVFQLLYMFPKWNEKN